MKKILITIFVSLLIFSACRKNNTASGDLSGSWKLIEVYDKNTSTSSSPPAGSNTDVVITFTNGSSFDGHTLRNEISDGTYTLNGDKITFGAFSMTEIAEDQWGGNFLTVLTACLLQSVSPCSPSIVTIQGNLMKIVTPLKYDVTLKKL